jgi:predicted HicB family RNase H-like nuclease
MAKTIDLLPPPKLPNHGPNSGLKTIAIRPEIHEQLKLEARKRGYTLHDFIHEILKRALNSKED